MSSKENILEAAIELFAEKGKHGTRMEEIAARAQINKAMVYYYYTSKDYLFEEVLKYIVQSVYVSIYRALENVSQDNDDPVMVVKVFLMAHFQAFINQKNFTKILLDAHTDEPEQIRTAFESMAMDWEKNIPQEMLDTFQRGVEQRLFRDINYKHVMISIIGMNLIYYFNKPIAQAQLNLKVDNEQQFLLERIESNIDLLFNGILVK